MDQPIGVRPRFRVPAEAPPLWGRSARFAEQHGAAARVQARYRGWIVWFGEAGGSYYAMGADGLYRRDTLDELVVLLWQRTRHGARPHRPGFRVGVQAW